MKVRSLKQKLVDEKLRSIFFPRLQMAVVLAVTGAVGFLTSLALLRLGISRLWLRYPLAIIAAYLAFLGLLYLWISFYRKRDDLDLLSDLDVPIDAGIGTSGSGGDADIFTGGGSFGGGGAGGAWEGGSSAPASFTGGSSLEGVGVDLDMEELGLVLVGLVLLIGGVVASLYVVYIAPVLLAEILVDALLVGGLYRRVKKLERRHWLETAVRRTWLPAALCATAFGIAGYLFQMVFPEAHTLGEVWRGIFS